MRLRPPLALALLLLALPAAARAQAPVDYELSFPEPHQRWMQVTATFRDLPAATPLVVHMSRTSPGRYALHEFVRNVYDVRVEGSGGRALDVTRPNAHRWRIAGHDGTVVFRYKVFGDAVNGTFNAIDDTHAHLNMPASLVWAERLEGRAARVTLRQPAGAAWKAATQLFATSDPLVFTAPNLAYLMDSPIEFGAITIRTFEVPVREGGPATTIRVAMHHLGTEAELDTYVERVRQIVLASREVFGELPDFEPGHYTSIVDYLPWARGDGMEHRNSTVVTSSGSLATSGSRLLGTVAHEFFHAWNVERIRPRSLEPFDLDEASVAEELWVAEGLTSYYTPLLMLRAGLGRPDSVLAQWGGLADALTHGAARRYHSATEMSLMAPLVDGAGETTPTNLEATYFSYYMHGAALGLAMDLTIRRETGSAKSLDDLFQLLWTRFGKPGGPAPGTVGHPYTLDDIEGALGEVTGNRGLAAAFFRDYVRGREAPPYADLLAQAGLAFTPVDAGQGFVGPIRYESREGGVAVTSLVLPGTPAYEAGLTRDMVVTRVDGASVASADALRDRIAGATPGTTLTVTTEWRGRTREHTVRVAPNPARRLVPLEDLGTPLSDAQRAFRDAWLRP